MNEINKMKTKIKITYCLITSHYFAKWSKTMPIKLLQKLRSTSIKKCKFAVQINCKNERIF
jgi:hypothetical protein